MTTINLPIDMTGTFFANAKRPGKQDPEFTGLARVGGKLVRASVWINVNKFNKPYLTVRFRDYVPVQASLDLEQLQLPEDIDQQPAA